MGRRRDLRWGSKRMFEKHIVSTERRKIHSALSSCLVALLFVCFFQEFLLSFFWFWIFLWVWFFLFIFLLQKQNSEDSSFTFVLYSTLFLIFKVWFFLFSLIFLNWCVDCLLQFVKASILLSSSCCVFSLCLSVLIRHSFFVTKCSLWSRILSSLLSSLLS